MPIDTGGGNKDKPKPPKPPRFGNDYCPICRKPVTSGHKCP